MIHMEEVDFMLVVGEPGTGKSSYLRHEAIEAASKAKRSSPSRLRTASRKQ